MPRRIETCFKTVYKYQLNSTLVYQHMAHSSVDYMHIRQVVK